MEDESDSDPEDFELCWTLDILQEDDSVKKRVYLISAFSLYDDEFSSN